MVRFRILVLGGCVGLGSMAIPTAGAQSMNVERDVSITGPGGRTIERHLSATRGGGVVDRQLSISRPGGALERSVRAQAVPAARGGFGGYGFGPPHHHGGHWYGPPPRSGLSPLASFGIGALAGAAVAAPLARMTAPSPVVVASPPVMVVGRPAVVAAPPPVVVEQPVVVSAPAVDPLDPVALAAQRLQSYSGGTRRDAAESLGLLSDPRGIPPLADVLKNDWNGGVRAAAATALGRIGGPEAEAVLGRAVVYEKKDAVRDAAALALRAARAKAAATPVVVESQSHVESVPLAAAASGAAASRPSAWEPSSGSRSRTDAIPLEAPTMDGEATPVPPPPAAGVRE